MVSPAGPGDKKLSRLISDIYFPKLRRLKFLGLSPSDFSLFDKTLRSEEGCNIHILETNCNKHLEKRGLLASLDTLIWSWHDPQVKLEFDLLKSNPQLTGLSISWPQRPVHMMRIVSLLSRSFSRLRSLRLTWDDTFIPGDALRLIGTITSLEQICLAAGEAIGWRHRFQIDHGAIRHNLASLSNLRKIAFDRDTYDTSAGNLGDYYSTPRHSDFPETWERNHKDTVVTEAKKYMQIFPELEWLYIGQLPMQISRHAAESLIVLSERDESSALLNRLFGYAGKVFVD
jgi:hypothetical protein